ncbi:MAG: hypothetical protein JWQ19_3880 [Subtercola sp.]|nr:hypothetical protein [Subtercola sp.]
MNLKQSVSRLAVCSAVAVGLFVSVGAATSAQAATDSWDQPAQFETAGNDSGMFGMHSGGGGYSGYDGGANMVPAGVVPDAVAAYFAPGSYVGPNAYSYVRSDGEDITGGDLDQFSQYKSNCAVDTYGRAILCSN